jgi:hypothetical protein
MGAGARDGCIGASIGRDDHLDRAGGHGVLGQKALEASVDIGLFVPGSDDNTKGGFGGNFGHRHSRAQGKGGAANALRRDKRCGPKQQHGPGHAFR